MYRAVLVLWLLGGCDYVFQIKTREAPDGGIGSGDDGAKTDARAGTCPAVGTPPAFTTNPVLLRSDLCAYTESVTANLAVGDCISTAGDGEGEPGSSLTTPLPLEMPTGLEQRNARLAPEGDRLLVLTRQSGDLFSTVQLYSRVGGMWVNPEPLPIVRVGVTDRASAPSALPQRHVIIAKSEFQASAVFEEWRDLGDGTWDTPFTYNVQTFGLFEIGQASLSYDGTRMVFVGFVADGAPQTVYYSERASIADPFTTATAIPVNNEARPLFPFLTESCDRLYLAGIKSLEWVGP